MSLITFETHQSEEQHDSGPIIVLTRKLQMKFGRIMWSGVFCPRLATFYVLGSYPLLPTTFYTCTHRLNTLQSTVWLDYNILRTGKQLRGWHWPRHCCQLTASWDRTMRFSNCLNSDTSPRPSPAVVPILTYWWCLLFAQSLYFDFWVLSSINGNIGEH